jgi:predicted Rossmann fold nucleotide-binding protein DprA/Smf involved in DNA uptake
MNAHELLSEDGHAALALCSSVGLKDGGDLAPLKLSEWNDLESRLKAASLTPANLHGKTAEALVSELSIDLALAERSVALLARGSRLALELERMFSAGIWALTRVDEAYPAKLASTLKQHAPSVLFGAGNIPLLSKTAVAIVGSRNIDEAAGEFAMEVGRKAVRAGLAVVSGGAKGSDRIGMQAALDAGGISIGAVADSLERTVRQTDVREFLLDGKLVLITPYAPTAGFSVGAAMGRNKLIYGMADYGVVVSSDYQTGGTWAGAVETLKAKWCPVFARTAESVPKGNTELLKLGAHALPTNELPSIDDLQEWFAAHATSRVPDQAELF